MKIGLEPIDKKKGANSLRFRIMSDKKCVGFLVRVGDHDRYKLYRAQDATTYGVFVDYYDTAMLACQALVNLLEKEGV